MSEQPNNPLHGKTTEFILNFLVDKYGWDELGARIPVNCFMYDPSIKSSLTFLEKPRGLEKGGRFVSGFARLSFDSEFFASYQKF